jgi:hypothetical protein
MKQARRRRWHVQQYSPKVLDHLALDEAADVDDRDLGMGERRLSMREAGTGAMRA